MSRVGKQPVGVPQGVTVTIQGPSVKVKGPKGELAYTLPGAITAAVAKGEVAVARPGDTAELRALHGTARNLIRNMITGVTEGYRKELEIQGVGYKAALQGQKLALSLGFSHPVEFVAPAGVKLEVAGDGLRVVVSGADKQAVGEAAARIRGYRKAEPYKGKGVRYVGEQVRRKAGKTVA